MKLGFVMLVLLEFFVTTLLIQDTYAQTDNLDRNYLHYQNKDIGMNLEYPDDWNLMETSRPDLSTKEAVSEQEWYQFLMPLLDPNAEKLTVSIREIQWFKRNQDGIDETRFGMRSSELSSEAKIPQEHYPPGKLVIIEGPWEFRVPIK